MMRVTNKNVQTWAISVSKDVVLCTLLIFAGGCSASHDKSTSFGPPPVVMKNGLNQEARDRFWSGVKPLSSLHESHYRLGRYYQKSGKHQLAIDEFKKAIKLEKGYVLAYNGLGMSYDALKDCRNAQLAYSNALLHGPDTAYLYNNLGCSRLLCDDPEHAIWFFTRAAELDKTSVRTHNNLMLAELRFKQQPPKKNQLSESAPLVKPVEQPPQVSGTEPAVPGIGSDPLQAVLGPPAPANLLLPESRNSADIKPSITPVVMTSKKLITNDGEPEVVPVGIPKRARILTIAPLKIQSQNQYGKPDQDISLCKMEVSNGNGITGMADRSAGYFRNLGFTVGRITNASHFKYESSRIYYQGRYLDIAKAVAGVVPVSLKFEQVEDLGRAGVGVRLLLGRDMAAIQFPDNLTQKIGKQETKGKLLAIVDSQGVGKY